MVAGVLITPYGGTGPRGSPKRTGLITDTQVAGDKWRKRGRSVGTRDSEIGTGRTHGTSESWFLDNLPAKRDFGVASTPRPGINDWPECDIWGSTPRYQKYNRRGHHPVVNYRTSVARSCHRSGG